MLVYSKFTLNTPCIINLTTPKNIKSADLELDENGMVKLTEANSKKVEALIADHNRYGTPSSRDWLKKHENINTYTLRELVEFIRLVARDNSTRTSNHNIYILANYIFANISITVFLNRIKKGDYSLVDELADLRHLGATRKEHSLASKVCRYIDDWYYGNDHFTINDSVVRVLLPYYYLYYGINFDKNIDEISYVEFMKYFNELVEKVQISESIKRHEIDHIIWYVYRNDSIRKAVVSAIVTESKNGEANLYIGCPYIAKETVVFPNINNNNVLF